MRQTHASGKLDLIDFLNESLSSEDVRQDPKPFDGSAGDSVEKLTEIS